MTESLRSCHRPISSYFETDGLASNAGAYPGIVRAIFGWDQQRHLAAQPTKRTFKNYSVADACRVQIFTGWVTASRARAARCSSVGLPEAVAFHPEDVSDNAIRRRCLTEFDLFGTPVRPGPHSPLERRSATRCGDLSYAQNTFSFEFSALSFPQPQPIDTLHARGLDANWHV